MKKKRNAPSRRVYRARQKSARRKHRLRKGRKGTNRRGPLPGPQVRCDDSNLTQFAGLIPFILFMTNQLRVPQVLKDVVGYVATPRVHAPHLVLFAFVVGALAGIERLAHLEWLGNDVALIKYLRLSYWPVRKVFSRALATLSDDGVARLRAFVTSLGLRPLRATDSVVVDFDTTAIVCFGNAQGAQFGYTGKGRRRKRHFPIVASVAETRTVVNALYRDGSKMTSQQQVDFVAQTLLRIREHLGTKLSLFVRGDSGFWSYAMRDWLNDNAVPYFIVMRMVPQLKLFLHKVHFEPMTDEPDIEFGSIHGTKIGMGNTRVVLIRRRVHEPKAPPMGKRVDGHPNWRYQAIATNQPWGPVDVWRFYNDRGDCERVFKVGKQALALQRLVGHDFRANEVAFLLRLLAYNADTLFELHCEERARQQGCKVLRCGLQWRQVRFFCSPGRLLIEGGRYVLRAPSNAKLHQLWEYYAPDLVENASSMEAVA